MFRRERVCELQGIIGDLNYVDKTRQCVDSEGHEDIQKPGRMQIRNVNFEAWEKF